MDNRKNTTESLTGKTTQNVEEKPHVASLANPHLDRESRLQRESKVNNDNTNTIEVSAQITLPPDGGWGWVVVLSSFLIYAISDGILLTFGCLYRSILTDLELSPALVSLINSITVASSFLFGPVVSAVINRYGFRICVMVGSAITSISCFLTFLFGNYASLLLFYGLLSGLGFAMINMAALIVVGFYFQRLRGIAFAISVTGGSIGVIISSLFYAHLTHFVGWRYTVMFQAGLVGLCYFISMTYKPLLSMTVVKATVTTDKDEEPLTMSAQVLSKITLKSANISRRSSLDEGGTRNIKSFNGNVDFPTAAEVINDINTDESRIAIPIQITSGASRPPSTIAIIPLNKKPDLHKNELERVRSLLNQVFEEKEESDIVDVHPVAEEKLPPANDLTIKKEKTEDSKIPDDKKNIESSTLLEDNKSRTCSLLLDGKRTRSVLLDARRTKSILMDGNRSRRGSVTRGILHWEDHVAEARPLYRDDAFLNNTISVLPTDRDHAEHNPIEYQLKVSRVATAEDLKQRKGLCTTAFTRVLFTMLDPHLLKRKSCLCVCFSMLFYYAGYLVPMIFVTDRGQDFGIPEEYTKWFLSAVGFSGIFGRFVGTFIAIWIHPVYVLFAMFMIAGASTLLSIFGSTVVLQLTYCTILGLCTAGTGALRTVIFAKLYGIEKLTNCTGIAYVFQGVGCLVSPPLAGALQGLWNPIPFVFSGFCLISSGLLLLPVISLVKKEDLAIEKSKSVS